MRTLIIGGTVFLGRALAASAVAAGHEVTLFNRGRSNPGASPEVETVLGDRDGELDRLHGRSFDAVIDTCGYVPRVVRAAAEAELAPYYMFVSSVSVYAAMDAEGTTEDAAVGRLEDPTVEQVTGETYGPLKALCEHAVIDAYGQRAAIVRPGLIVGPHDPTDRFTYWPRRAARGGKVLAPMPQERRVQVIDVRDLADWMIAIVGAGVAGPFNSVGPHPPVTMQEVLAACMSNAPSGSEVVWVSEDHLLSNEVGPWTELPLWIPTDAEGMRRMMAADVSRAVASGLTFRPIAETVDDTLAWDRERGMPDLKAGLAPEKEERVLASWLEAVG